MSGKHSNDYSEDYVVKQHYSSNNKNKRNRRKKSKANLVFKILALIYLIISISFYISILRMNLLPTTYTIAFTIAEIIFTLAMTIGLAKKHKSYALNILCLIIVVIMSSLYIYANNYANATTDFLGNAFTETEETEDYYLVVRKDSSYNSIEDIKGKEIYFYQIEDDVKKEVGTKVTVTLKSKDNLMEIGKNLLNNKLDVILVSSSQYSMLSEEIEKFANNTKILHTATHKIQKETSVKVEGAKYSIDNGIFNVYISGIDTSGRISNVSRSDANIVATINTKTHEVLLTSIPRDYYVTLHSKKAKDKLTHSGIYGINETVTTVEDLLDVDINYYVRVNFTTVIKLVDTLGGIDVYSDYNFSSQGYYFNRGYNHMNGSKALAFSRERYAFSSGDNQRVKNQQHVIEAIIKKALSGSILTKYTSILKTLEGSFQTNIEQAEISSLVKGQLEDMTSWTVKTNALTGSNASRSTYSAGSQLLYVMIPDSTSVQSAKDQIPDVMGE